MLCRVNLLLSPVGGLESVGDIRALARTACGTVFAAADADKDAAQLRQLSSDNLGTAGIWPSAAHNLAMTFDLHGPACSGDQSIKRHSGRKL